MLHELERTYLFPKNESISISDVRTVEVSKSGGHRLTTKQGGMVYIPHKWLAIDIFSNHGWEQ